MLALFLFHWYGTAGALVNNPVGVSGASYPFLPFPWHVMCEHTRACVRVEGCVGGRKARFWCVGVHHLGTWNLELGTCNLEVLLTC